MYRYLYITFTLLVIFNSKAVSEPVTNSTQFQTNSGFHSLTLPIKDFRNDSNVWKGLALGDLNGKLLGFNFEIKKHTKEEISNGNTGEYSIKFIFSGTTGENFLIALKNQLGIKSPTQKPKTSHIFEANGVLESENAADGLPEEFELINLHDEKNYGEWYLKINQTNSSLTLNEKNETYREALILTLASK